MAKIFHNRLGILLMLGVAFALVSCTGFPQGISGSTVSVGLGGGTSLKQDYWGHRPGPKGFRTVIIDAGHGGRDSGATANGHQEKDLALDAAKLLKKELSGEFRVVLVRSRDKFVDLDRGVSLANRYSSAVLVSMHYNSSRSSRTRGPETYYWRVDSYSLAKRIQRNLTRASHGRQRSLGLVRRRLRLTRNPSIPCVLVELGYLSSGFRGTLVTQPSLS
ncbi:MAG: N-acetylmuramoyl-L-alanine amidase [Akkermansiaceae bacterium]